MPDVEQQSVMSAGLVDPLFSFYESFGYDSQKKANLHILPGPVVLYAAGNLLVFRNLKTNTIEYKRSPAGSVGALTVHDSYKYFVVAGKGTSPPILIYSYPEIKVEYILNNGAQRSFAYLEFSPDGNLLASVSGSPDYLLTLWNWRTMSIVLRCKAYSLDIFKVSWSPDLAGQLCSSGIGHIRFWNMAKTFTGLKLQGQLGRFGKTSVSDIEGFVQLPDGKVVSGSEWGNMLVWDGGLIKVEVSRKNGKPCHEGPIQQLTIHEGELLSVGIDGHIRVWDLESIDQADSSETSNIYELEPMSVLKVGEAEISSMILSPDDENTWYGQDMCGAIWQLDLSFSHTQTEPEVVARFHGGVIRGLSASPDSHVIATTGDNQVRIVDVVSRTTLTELRFPASVHGSSLLWPTLPKAKSSNLIVVGFTDGTLRLLSFGSALNTNALILRQALRPHGAEITAIHQSPSKDFIATASKDSTMFIFSYKNDTLKPLGFVPSTGKIIDFLWRSDTVLLVWCENGTVTQITIPSENEIDTSHTFKIDAAKFLSYTFQSCKSKLARQRAKSEWDTESARLRSNCDKKLKLMQKAAKDRGEEVTSDELKSLYEKVDSMAFEELEEYSFIPPERACVTWAREVEGADDEFYCQMDGYDAGLIYKCKLQEIENIAEPLDQSEPIDAFLLNDDTPIFSWVEKGDQIFAGFEDGRVRIYYLKGRVGGLTGPSWSEDELRDGKIMSFHHTIEMHDCQLGAIHMLELTYDGAFLFSAGNDGNLFSYYVTPSDQIKTRDVDKVDLDGLPWGDEVKGTYSLEEDKQKSEMDRKMREAEATKTKKRKDIVALREEFDKLRAQNEKLPSACRLTDEDFELHPDFRIQAEQQCAERIEMLKKQSQWDLEKSRLQLKKVQKRFRDHVEEDRIILYQIEEENADLESVASYDLDKLSNEIILELQREIAVEKNRDRSRVNTPEARSIHGESHEMSTGESQTLFDQMKNEQESGSKAVRKAEERKRRKEKRKMEWKELYDQKPDEKYVDPKDEEELRVARATIGNFQLKTAADYVVPEHLRSNTSQKRHQIAILTANIHERKNTFNGKVRALRDEKIKIRDSIMKVSENLDKMQECLPQDEWRQPPAIPVIRDEELPEKLFIVDESGNEGIIRAASGRKKSGKFSRRKSTAEFAFEIGVRSSTSVIKRLVSNLTLRENDFSLREDDLSDFELGERHRNRILARNKRDTTLGKAFKRVSSFNADVHMLSLYRAKLDEELVMAHLRLDTLHQELLLLKDFEKREDAISNRVDNKQLELDDIKHKLSQSKLRYDAKRKEVEKLSDKEKNILSQFQLLLGENNKFGDYLNKVFKKKIKRVTQTQKENSDDESESESSDDDSDWSDEDSDAEPFDDTQCPAGCDQKLFEMVLDLRSKKCSIEDEVSDSKKVSDTLRKETDSFQKKLKVLESQLTAGLADLEAFQVEKQGKLNELWVVVPLTTDQMDFSEEPENIPGRKGLVVPSATISKLNARIDGLKIERQAESQKYRSAGHENVALRKGNAEMTAEVDELEKKCEEAMMLKFGRVVDIDNLGTVTVSRAVEEAREVVRQNEWRLAREEHALEQKVVAMKVELSKRIEANTERIERLAQMKRENDNIQQVLDQSQHDTRPDDAEERNTKDRTERERLKAHVNDQQNEIQLLKEQIGRLSQKGGHMMPSQPPMMERDSRDQ